MNQIHQVYNILPLQNDHCPFFRPALAAVRAVGNLKIPQCFQWEPHFDLIDWLSIFFGFQASNVDNQREHLVLHLVNAQMRHSAPSQNLDPNVLHNFRHRLLESYSSWCSYLNVTSNVLLSDTTDARREILYVSLYLLIWGESANLRFLPECICYIFHHMSMELNKILDDDYTGSQFLPFTFGENGYLNLVVKPIYDTIKSEVVSSRKGTAPYSSWRNYDDINEYFWTKQCFEKLKWPIDLECDFFEKGRKGQKVGFVEQRSFLCIFRSFHRLWVMLILFLQAAIIVAWEENLSPWQALRVTEIQVKLFTIFCTWSALMFMQSLLDAAMQYRLVSRGTKHLGIRMFLKCVFSAGWILLFLEFYERIWEEKNVEGKWTHLAQKRIWNFIQLVMLFVAPGLLEVALFILPCVRMFLQTRNWKIMHFLSWWFKDRTFIGRRLREGFLDDIKCTLFWVVVLVTKFCFSYVWQIKTMIPLSKTLLTSNQKDDERHQLFNKKNWFIMGIFWLPVALIYFMDLQIWYAVYSSFVGSFLGLFYRLGEIRNMEQLRLRFQYIASDFHSNLIPEEHHSKPNGTFWSVIKKVIHHLKIRHGFKKLEFNQVKIYKFAWIWNEMINVFREEDIISDKEVELLELPQIDTNDPKCNWEIRVIQWPCLFLRNELLLALSQAQKFSDAPDNFLWSSICKVEYRRCAVIEAYDSLKHFLLAIVNPDSEDHSIIINLFQEIDQYIQLEEVTSKYDLTALPEIQKRLGYLLNSVLLFHKDADMVAIELQAVYETTVRKVFRERRSIDQLRQDGMIPHRTMQGNRSLFEDSVELPSASNDIFYRQARRLCTIVTCQDSMREFPQNPEARRRISFFSNSLLMRMPRAPQVEKMTAFSVLTPCKKEDVLYSKEILLNDTSRIPTLHYLKNVYPDDWGNFLERMYREGMKYQFEQHTTKLMDLQLWASYRGQTLARTVRGIMYYYRAIRMLAFLESASYLNMREESQQIGSLRHIDDSVDDISSPPSRHFSEGIILAESQLGSIRHDDGSVSGFSSPLSRNLSRGNSLVESRQSDVLRHGDDSVNGFRSSLSRNLSEGNSLVESQQHGFLRYDDDSVNCFSSPLSRNFSKGSSSVGSQQLGFLRHDDDGLSSPPLRNSREGSSLVYSGFNGYMHWCASLKFTYIVSFENYGFLKAIEEPYAQQILYLMKNNRALRVAYIDKVFSGRDEIKYYSVLVKFDQELQREVEIYRIMLPGPAQLGEGKPENQNHAIIFTRGEALQAIDANQDSYFEEALKMRNLLEEFNSYHGIKRPTILGVREHIFSGLDSAPAQFMGAQETSFVTLGQRVMANLLKVRMHYGHPDLFDRFWFLTRGGISKGSRMLNINEDIYAGFNSTLRQGNVTHHEYIQLGKGRDVGLNQISTFEAKIAGGNAEQTISRDVYRLGTKLDFFRMLSFFHTSVGFFFNAWMVVLAFYTYWWGRLYLALSGVEESFISGKSDEKAVLVSILSQEIFVSLGLFVALPTVMESTLEKGFFASLYESILSFFQLSPVFYTFSLGTRAHYFGRTLIHGGAKYRATERIFAVQHVSFVENYRLFARSHFIKGIELGLIIIVYSIYSPVSGGTFLYLSFTLVSWFMVFSWLLCPFIFNPLTFDWLPTVIDFNDFVKWIRDRSFPLAGAEKSWEKWRYEEHDHLRSSSLWGKITEIILNLRFFFFQYGITYKLDSVNESKIMIIYLASWIYVFIAAGIYVTLAFVHSKYNAKAHIYYRIAQSLSIIISIAVIVMLASFTNFSFHDVFIFQLASLPTGWGLISIAIVLRRFLEGTFIWDHVVSIARLYEMMFGVIVFSPVAFFSWFPGIHSMQCRILFNGAFGRGIDVFVILHGKEHEG